MAARRPLPQRYAAACDAQQRLITTIAARFIGTYTWHRTPACTSCRCHSPNPCRRIQCPRRGTGCVSVPPATCRTARASCRLPVPAGSTDNGWTAWACPRSRRAPSTSRSWARSARQWSGASATEGSDGLSSTPKRARHRVSGCRVGCKDACTEAAAPIRRYRGVWKPEEARPAAQVTVRSPAVRCAPMRMGFLTGALTS